MKTETNAIEQVLIKVAYEAGRQAAIEHLQQAFKQKIPENTGNYKPLDKIATHFGSKLSTVKYKLWAANKLGIPMPDRVKVGKGFLYDVQAFERWFVENADALRNFKQDEGLQEVANAKK